MAETKLDTIRKNLGLEYDFLANRPPYEFDVQGLYKAETYKYICENLEGGYAPHKNKDICINFFSYLEGIMMNGVVGNNKEFLETFKKWFSEKKPPFHYTSEFMFSFNNHFKKVIQNSVMDDFNEFKDYGWNNLELTDLFKLYYFSKNITGIKQIMETGFSHGSYKKCCKFVNECIDIFRKYKNAKCAGGLANKRVGNTVCFELESFFNTFENILYPHLKSKNAKVVSLKDINENDRFFCSIEETKPGYNPYGIFFKFTKLEFTPLEKSAIGGFSVFAAFLVLFILYKFTSFGSAVNPRMRRTRRMWRNVEREHMNQMNEHAEMFANENYRIPSRVDSYSSLSSSSLYGME
ncbi:PIR Superfamily Protein [Plasmodium ovale wallikeri]|uniref:PIR Superfamily Protein n=1 Tax=Plasmodium ovale wallikeri TaxID=864142 RepID=A0A1A9APT9_PLAOA|nr:PIR Superfamily Protein [Plasmodium ovale wallikeri]